MPDHFSMVKCSDCQQLLLPYNLRPTTHECVHLVKRGHFRSRDKDGGHTFRSAVSKNPMNACKPHGFAFYRSKSYGRLKFLHCGNRDFRPFCSCDLDLDPMTFRLYTNLTGIPWRYTGCGDMKMNCLPYRYVYRLSKVTVTADSRQTRPKLYTTPLRAWSVNRHTTRCSSPVFVFTP